MKRKKKHFDAENGADLIELGIPFSDPTAEGPVIMEANERALRGGVTTDKIFDLVRTLRKTVTVPMVFMTYVNVVFSYGAERFLPTCKEIGIDGLILPDLPFEEKEEFEDICDRKDHRSVQDGCARACGCIRKEHERSAVRTVI